MLKTISALKNAMLVTAKFTEIFYSCGHSHFIKLSMKEKKHFKEYCCSSQNMSAFFEFAYLIQTFEIANPLTCN